MTLINFSQLKSKKNNISKDLTTLMGDGVKVKENPKSKENKEKKFFSLLVDTLIGLDHRTISLLDYGIDVIEYEGPYHNIIEGFISLHYGPVAGEIVLWWIKERSQGPDKNLSIKINEGKETMVNTPLQLYRAVKKINKMLDA